MTGITSIPPDVGLLRAGPLPSQAPARFLSDETVAGSSSAGATPADRVVPVRFTMPTPPSANHLFRNVKGVGRVKASHYEDFIRMGVAAIRRQSVPKIPGYVVMIIGVERMSARADIDNRMKALIDAIVASEIIDDDNLVTALAIAWLPKANGLSHVCITPVSKIGLTFHPSQNGACGGFFMDAPFETGDEYGDQPL